MKFRKTISVPAAVLLAAAVPAYCADGDIKVMIDSKAVSFDVLPQIVNDRTLVPMRAIFEALGAQVEWDGVTGTVTAYASDNTVIELSIGADIMKKTTGSLGERIVKLDTPPQIIDDRTLVPVRAVAEGLDARVEWERETRTVNITTAAASAAAEAPAGTAAPEAPAQASKRETDFGIEYDYRAELETSDIRDFKITGLEKTDDAKFRLTYKVSTFFEGRGVVTVSFECLDKDGKIVDSWSKGFIGTDYTWSPHEDTVTISGDTKRIELNTNKK